MKSLYHQSKGIEGMNLRIVVLIAAIAVLTAGGVTPAVAQVSVGIGIQIGPPPLRREAMAPRPNYTAEWVRGYWSWAPAIHKHVWVPGKWVAARPGYRWVDGGWKRGQRGWVWTEGHWRAGRGGRVRPEGRESPSRGEMRR